MAKVSKSPLKSFVLYVGEFCKHTSIHGLRYVTEEGRHWFERILWLALCILSVLGAAMLISEVWRKYTTTPTITTVENTQYPIWNIPFPAITICNVNKVHFSIAKDIYKEYGLDEDLTSDEWEAFVAQLAEIIQPESVDAFTRDIAELERMLNIRGLNMEKLMRLITQPCSAMMLKCKWRGELTSCEELFRMHKTDAGFCCSFNYFPPDGNASEMEVGSRRVNGAGYLTGFTALLDPRLEDYYAALFSFYGLQVLVHGPHDYPVIAARGLILAPKREAFLQVSAESTYSTHAVRGLSVEQRQCVFADEAKRSQKLGNSAYSFGNCVVRCRLHHLASKCNCTPYFYPNTGDIRQCGLLDVKCLAKHRRLFNNLRPPVYVDGLAGTEGMDCDCQPACVDVVYNSEMSQGLFFKSEYDRTHFFKEVDITNHSILHVYFKDLSSIRFRRDVIYNWNDLLASFGGIVGLFLGCSLLSAFEVAYFFSLRVACGLHMRRRREPSATFPEGLYPRKLRVRPAPNVPATSLWAADLKSFYM